MPDIIFYFSKKIEKFIRSKGVFPEDLMYAIQTFFEKKNPSDIKHVQFAISDEVEANKRKRRRLEVGVCTNSQNADEIKYTLFEMLTVEFPSLNAFVRIHCEYE